MELDNFNLALNPHQNLKWKFRVKKVMTPKFLVWVTGWMIMLTENRAFLRVAGFLVIWLLVELQSRKPIYAHHVDPLSQSLTTLLGYWKGILNSCPNLNSWLFLPRLAPPIVFIIFLISKWHLHLSVA